MPFVSIVSTEREHSCSRPEGTSWTTSAFVMMAIGAASAVGFVLIREVYRGNLFLNESVRDEGRC